jgi:predicted Fe-Mo cluster-binding NifX family protein
MIKILKRRVLRVNCKAAIASTDQENVNMHFGKCAAFTIAEYDDTSGDYRITEVRSVRPPCPSCGANGDPDDAINEVIDALSDCNAVIVSRIGKWPDALLYERGIKSVQCACSIRDAMRLCGSRALL